MQMCNGILAKNFKNNGVADISLKSHIDFLKKKIDIRKEEIYVQLFKTLKLAFLTSYKLRVNETYSYSSLMHKDFVYLA